MDAPDASGPGGENLRDCGRMALRWRVIVTAPRAETLARDSLQSRDFTTFLPMVVRPFGQRRITQPLFPGYLFALIDTTLPTWGNVFRSQGVEDVLRAPGSTIPASVPRQAVEAIMAHCSALQAVIDDPRPALIAAGVQVHINAGLWAGHNGVCLWSSHERIALLMDIMGRELRVVMPRRAVSEAG